MFSENNNLRNIQKCSLEILKVVATICKKRNTRYFLAEGTLLGGVRHNGFIPWDDDVDICMPREDFESFAGYINEELPPRFSAKHCTEMLDVWGTLRITDETHTLMRNYNGHDIYFKTSIDVFPIDGMPENRLLQHLHILHIYLRYVPLRLSQIESWDLMKHRPLVIQLIRKGILFLSIQKLIDERKALLQLTKVLTLYPYDKSTVVFSFYSEYRKKTIVPKICYGIGRDIIFENTHLCAPFDSERILTQEYGNYQVLPPENMRHSKHGLTFIS